MATEQDELQALVEQVPDEILDYIEQLEDRVEKAETFIASVTEMGEPEDAEIEKALADLPPAAAELFRAQAAQLAEAQAQLNSESIAKADAEWTNVARSVDGLIDSPESFGPMLRQVAEIDADLAKSIVSALQTANARLEKSALYSEIGHVAPAAGSAEEKVTHLAKSLREVHPDKTEADAIGEVLEANPELYDQYTAEQRERSRS